MFLCCTTLLYYYALIMAFLQQLRIARPFVLSSHCKRRESLIPQMLKAKVSTSKLSYKIDVKGILDSDLMEYFGEEFATRLKTGDVVLMTGTIIFTH